MQRFTKSGHVLAVITRWSKGIAIAFVGVLLIIMTATLGKALGATLIAYGVALGIVGALAVLVAYVMLTESTHTGAVKESVGDGLTLPRERAAA